MILLALGTVAAITAFSAIAISLADRPPPSPVSIYEMTRIVRGEQIVDFPRKVIRRGIAPDAPVNDDAAEQLLAKLLAVRLGVSAADVRVHLQADQWRAALMARQVALYGANTADPSVAGGFTIFVRRPDGSWSTYKRIVDYWQARSLRFWQYRTFYLGLLVVLPLAMLISSRLTRPVRAFAASADRIGAGLEDSPVPEVGPTEIRQAAVALNEMQARIAQFARERTTLVGAIAHDLRTPLSNLRFRIANADADTRASAEEEIQRMEELISSTLDYVDSEGRPMVTEPIDLGSLVQSLTDEYRDRSYNVSLDSHEKIVLAGDLIRLRRLFANLIENGLKFGKRVEVSYRQDNQDAVIDIVDDGPGMTSEDLSRAFEPFFRSERSRNRSTGGIGLGLSIAGSAAHAHGGTIELTNLERGFRARVRMPVEGPAQGGGIDRRQ
ncbi:MAG: HAMP domain-containing sensor histidine kinase [Novosphingobium sp.]